MELNEDKILIESVNDDVDKVYGYIVNLWHHMLKWDHQRYIQSPSWSTSIDNRANDIKKIFNGKNGSNIKNRIASKLNDAYSEAIKMTIKNAIKDHKYMTSKISKNIQNDYSLDYILDDDNRHKWIHSRCGNTLLLNSNEFKYDTIKEVNDRIDPKYALK